MPSKTGLPVALAKSARTMHIFVRQRVHLVREKHARGTDRQSDSNHQDRDTREPYPPASSALGLAVFKVASRSSTPVHRRAVPAPSSAAASMSGLYPADLRNKEPIPSLWNCFNVSGVVSVIVQRIPQLAHRHAEAAVKIYKRISRPEAASKFLSS